MNMDTDSYCNLHLTTVLIIIICCSFFGTWRQTCILMRRGNKKIVSLVVWNCH